MSDSRIDEWMAEARAGDTRALQKLIVLYHARLRALACRKLGPELAGKIDPDDVLQQVYVDVCGRMGQFRDGGAESFFGWLRRILESKLVDARRFYHAAARDVNREAAPPSSVSRYAMLARRGGLDSVTPSRIVARRESEAIVMAALATLTPDQRTAVELRYLRGRSLKDAAEEMGRSSDAVQMLAARGLRALRESIRRLSRD
ncbi:MAG: RNA polymerase sigma factor [Phycisphaerae bacterium]|nr:RNA polymerase sigma factor [Phycisphaerae bacterium]